MFNLVFLAEPLSVEEAHRRLSAERARQLASAAREAVRLHRTRCHPMATRNTTLPDGCTITVGPSGNALVRLPRETF